MPSTWEVWTVAQRTHQPNADKFPDEKPRSIIYGRSAAVVGNTETGGWGNTAKILEGIKKAPCLDNLSKILGSASTALPVSTILFEIKVASVATNFWSWLMWIMHVLMDGRGGKVLAFSALPLISIPSAHVRTHQFKCPLRFVCPQGSCPPGFEIGVCICVSRVASGDPKSDSGTEAKATFVHTEGGKLRLLGVHTVRGFSS